MERAIFRTILFILSLMLDEARKKFRFSPNSCLVPKGSLFLVKGYGMLDYLVAYT
jgi:hypothetical protein